MRAKIFYVTRPYIPSVTPCISLYSDCAICVAAFNHKKMLDDVIYKTGVLYNRGRRV